MKITFSYLDKLFLLKCLLIHTFLKITLKNIMWILQVPAGKKIKIEFSMFRVKEPGVDTSTCHKDYIEVLGKR